MSLKIKSIKSIISNETNLLNFSFNTNRKSLFSLCRCNKKYFNSFSDNETNKSPNDLMIKEQNDDKKPENSNKDIEAIKENKTKLEKLEKQAISK